MLSTLFEQNNLREISITSDCNDDGQINLSASFYYHNNKLVYINYNRNEEHSNYTDHYYVWDNSLIFYFSEYASWIWDYECTPTDQGFTNEIWIYEEGRIYFSDRTAIKCLIKKYENNSADHLNTKHELSDTVKNEEIDCDEDQIKEIFKAYLRLLSLQDNDYSDMCNIFDHH